jgi:hypothetical protein
VRHILSVLPEALGRRTEGRAPMLALAGILLLLFVEETARELTNAEPGQGVIFDLFYAVAEAFLGAYIVAAVALVVGAMVFLLTYLRGGRITFPEAIFNWVVVGAAAVAVLLVYLE